MGKPFIITRKFKASQQLLWDCFTQAERVDQWMSPKGFKTVKMDRDFKVGGKNHYCQEGPDGMKMWGLQEFKEISPIGKLVYTQAFSDEKGGLTRHPMAPLWPPQMLTTVLFKAAGAETEITLSWEALNATAEEQAFFDNAHQGMAGGWGGSFEQLDAYLASI
jgi:uncharacterized protein YndB with AHSA1/START domain